MPLILTDLNWCVLDTDLWGFSPSEYVTSTIHYEIKLFYHIIIDMFLTLTLIDDFFQLILIDVSLMCVLDIDFDKCMFLSLT